MLNKIILVAILFILVGNIKYGDDVFFILAENISGEFGVGTFSAKRDDGVGERRRWCRRKKMRVFYGMYVKKAYLCIGKPIFFQRGRGTDPLRRGILVIFDERD